LITVLNNDDDKIISTGFVKMMKVDLLPFFTIFVPFVVTIRMNT